MSYDSEPDVLVQLALRLKNFSSTEVLAGLFDLDVAATQNHLDRLQSDGFAAFRDGRVSGWSATAEGRIATQKALNEELAAAGCRSVVEPNYRAFLALNAPFLTVCTRWQVKDADAGVLNEHDDPTYDQSVIAELGAIDEHVQPICAELAAAMSRFGRLGAEFAAALAKVRAGESPWFTKPTIDSYHTIWFELHETLLGTLDIDRASEQAG